MRIRNCAEEKKARELRKLLDSIDPHPAKKEPPPPAPAMSALERPAYRPEQMGSVRSGADEHQKYKSKGV